MPTYVALVNYTDQGIRSVKDTVQRARAVRTQMEQRGVKLSSIYWTQGRYDLVVTIEAPDELAASAALLGPASAGNVRTETLRAFDEAEMEAILGRI